MGSDQIWLRQYVSKTSQTSDRYNKYAVHGSDLNELELFLESDCGQNWFVFAPKQSSACVYENVYGKS